MTLKAIGSSSGLEGQVPRSLGSSLEELETLSEMWVELSKAEREEVDGDAGAGVGALVTFTRVFFFFLLC